MSLIESDVRETVTAIIATQLDVSPDEILGDTSIKEDRGADSLNVMTFTMTIENRFKVHLQEEAARKPLTVNIIVDKVLGRITETRAQ